MRKITVHKCRGCGMEHLDWKDAAKCCPATEVVERFQCEICGDFFPTEEEAEACCNLARIREELVQVKREREWLLDKISLTAGCPPGVQAHLCLAGGASCGGACCRAEWQRIMTAEVFHANSQ